VTKKWYHYFVVTDGSAEPGAVPLADAASPAQRVTDLVPHAEADTTFAAPVTTPTDFSEIYSSAQIAAPAHGYTVLKVAEMLRSEHIQGLPADVRQRSVLVALDAAGVKVAEIVEDAVRRDRALDTYERVLQKHLEELRAQKAAENKQFEDEVNQRVAELRSRIEQNNAEVSREQESLAQWRVRKRQEEERIAEAVGHFVSENPVTTTDRAVKDKGDANVR
jgi:Asp-tRNA(Asn)/Glu-tRNA(Gln) amidotransferase A subunit family amidase